MLGTDTRLRAAADVTLDGVLTERVVRIDIEGVPNVLAALRRELAAALRREAAIEGVGYRTAEKLLEIANNFEAGVCHGDS